MALTDDLERIASAAQALAAADERVSGVLAAEPQELGRLYLCAYETGEGGRAWLALDDAARPVADARAVREAASLAALCEVAAESAGGPDLDELRLRLAELKATDEPEGIDDAIAAADALAAALAEEPRVATTEWLDRVGVLSRRLEHALGTEAASPFSTAMQQAMPAVEELTADIQRSYRGPLA